MKTLTGAVVALALAGACGSESSEDTCIVYATTHCLLAEACANPGTPSTPDRVGGCIDGKFRQCEADGTEFLDPKPESFDECIADMQGMLNDVNARCDFELVESCGWCDTSFDYCERRQ